MKSTGIPGLVIPIAISSVTCAICLNPKSADLWLALAIIAPSMLALHQIIKPKHFLPSYASAVAGVIIGLVLRMIYDQVNHLYDHNLAGIEIAIVGILASIASSLVMVVDIGVWKLRDRLFGKPPVA